MQNKAISQALPLKQEHIRQLQLYDYTFVLNELRTKNIKYIRQTRKDNNNFYQILYFTLIQKDEIFISSFLYEMKNYISTHPNNPYTNLSNLISYLYFAKQSNSTINPDVLIQYIFDKSNYSLDDFFIQYMRGHLSIQISQAKSNLGYILQGNELQILSSQELPSPTIIKLASEIYSIQFNIAYLNKEVNNRQPQILCYSFKPEVNSGQPKIQLNLLKVQQSFDIIEYNLQQPGENPSLTIQGKNNNYAFSKTSNNYLDLEKQFSCSQVQTTSQYPTQQQQKLELSVENQVSPQQVQQRSQYPTYQQFPSEQMQQQLNKQDIIQIMQQQNVQLQEKMSNLIKENNSQWDNRLKSQQSNSAQNLQYVTEYIQQQMQVSQENQKQVVIWQNITEEKQKAFQDNLERIRQKQQKQIDSQKEEMGLLQLLSNNVQSIQSFQSSSYSLEDKLIGAVQSELKKSEERIIAQLKNREDTITQVVQAKLSNFENQIKEYIKQQIEEALKSTNENTSNLQKEIVQEVNNNFDRNLQQTKKEISDLVQSKFTTHTTELEKYMQKIDQQLNQLATNQDYSDKMIKNFLNIEQIISNLESKFMEKLQAISNGVNEKIDNMAQTQEKNSKAQQEYLEKQEQHLQEIIDKNKNELFEQIKQLQQKLNKVSSDDDKQIIGQQTTGIIEKIFNLLTLKI